jgi:hypothetical protein
MGDFLKCLKETFKTLKGEEKLHPKWGLILIFIAFSLCIAHFVHDFIKHVAGEKNGR